MTTEAPATLSVPTSAGSFFGWRIAGVAFLAQFLATGVTLSPFSNFVVPVAESFSVSQRTIALGTTIAIASFGLMGPIVGRLVDRGHARLLMIGGALLSGSGLFLLGRVDELWLLGVVYGACVCVGAALFGVMPSATLVANWFVKRRGFALGITFAGATIASAVAPVAAQFLIDTTDWRSALDYFGAAVLLLGVPAFSILVIGRPEEVGQLPDGETPSAETSQASGIRSLEDLAREPRLWLISLGFGLLLTSPIVLITLLVPFGLRLGFSGQEASLFFVAAMPFSLVGKLFLGALADRAPAKPIIALIVLANVVSWLIFYSQPNYALFILSGAIYGVGIGGVAPVQGVVMGRCFGRVNFGTASGLGGMLTIVCLVLASLMSYVLQGEKGEGYGTLFVTQACLLLLGGLILAAVKIPVIEEAVDAAD